MRRSLVLLALVGLLIAGLVAWIKIAEARAWARLERRVEELRAEPAPGGPRETGSTASRPGNAWDLYLRALDGLPLPPSQTPRRQKLYELRVGSLMIEVER